MARFTATSQISPSNWLGLAWVYSGVLWAVPIWLAWSAGSVEQVGLAVARMLATVAVGVGICGNERWAWATAVVLASSYLLLSVSLGGVVTVAMASRPEGALSWQPVLWGLIAAQCLQLGLAAGLVALCCLVAMALLWHTRGGFDVPQRQAYGTMVRCGLVPALGILALDGLLLISWWG